MKRLLLLVFGSIMFLDLQADYRNSPSNQMIENEYNQKIDISIEDNYRSCQNDYYLFELNSFYLSHIVFVSGEDRKIILFDSGKASGNQFEVTKAYPDKRDLYDSFFRGLTYSSGGETVSLSNEKRIQIDFYYKQSEKKFIKKRMLLLDYSKSEGPYGFWDDGKCSRVISELDKETLAIIIDDYMTLDVFHKGSVFEIYTRSE